MRLDHDGIFKQLLSAFLSEFLELFAPDLLELFDPQAISLLPTESFVNLLDPDRRNADLLVQIKSKASPGAILIHLEHQAQHDDILDRRMFRYFARFYDHYDSPICPMVLCSYPSPRRAAAQRHHLSIGKRTILNFEYQVVQLNHLDWRDYLGHANPLATALMARMRIARNERWFVKAAALKQLMGMTLDSEERRMLATFISIYLPLNARETAQFNADVATWQDQNKEPGVEFISEWEQQGRKEGRKEGRCDLLLYQLEHRFGPVPAALRQQLMAMPSKRLLALSTALFELTSLDAVQTWVDQDGCVDGGAA
ncbi:DUF4351 domain-containing protein [Candidatus Viridilinea mediisalina]|uniref:DUF4351 domain-containing protein n=1 Tax=Candidatus Viridilinea mediisalina TaxID=2024553 RepID=A0A2A6RJV1_9CHLR|nr:DUF4351 domain-containing protein [Candidatus Viridilinea mediisalina]PDW03175.1 hypothetical protein CJ255_10200 [Candidatus Viridilinea mediisalina]